MLSAQETGGNALAPLRHRPHTLYWALGAAVSAFLICSHDLSKRQLWRDEHATWWAATLSLSDLTALLKNVDVVFAPYYLFMHGWTSIVGDTPYRLRLPSAIAMAGASALIVLLGKRVANTTTGVIAGLLFSLIPSVSAYGQEARPYAFAIAASVLSTLTFLWALEKPSVGRWATYGVTVSIVGFCHLVALTVLLAHGGTFLVLHAFGSEEKVEYRAFGRWGAATLLALVPVAPLVWIGATQTGQVGWIQNNEETWQKFLGFPGALFGSGVVAGIVVGLAILGALVPKRRANIVLSLWAILPPIFLFLSYPKLHLFYFRYMLFTLPAWVLVASTAFSHAKAERQRSLFGALAALIVVGAVGLVAQYDLRQPLQKTAYDYRGVAREIRKDLRQGDALAIAGKHSAPAHIRTALHYELRDSLPQDVFAQRSAQEIGRFAPEECPEPAACLPDNTRRIWLVTNETSGTPFGAMPSARAALLESSFQISKSKTYNRLRLILLIRKEVSENENAG